MGKRLDDHIDSVRSETASKIDDARNETTSRVDELVARVTSFEAEVDRRLPDVAEAVSSRLAEERQRDIDAFRDLAETPTRDSLIAAMKHALDLGVIDLSTPLRVQIDDEDLYIEIDYFPEDDIELGLVPLRGDVVLSPLEWTADESVDDVMVHLGRTVQQETSLVDFDLVGDFFVGPSDLLQVGLRAPSYRPIVMLRAPQWAINARRRQVRRNG